MRYDDLLSLLGDFGRYQKILYCILIVPTGIIGMQILSPIFILAVPEHRCAIPNLSNDTYAIQNDEHGQLVDKYIPMTTDNSGVESYSSCTIYDITDNSTGMNNSKEVPCSKWVYDTSVFQDTVVTELNLVCDKTIYRAHATTALNIGSLLGYIVMGSISDRFGRKKTYVLEMVLTSVFSLLLVWTPSIYVFVAIRFIVGFTVGVFYNTAFVYVMEFIGPSKRTLCGMLTNHVWTFGLFVYTGLAYGIRNWRYLQIASSVPCCLMIVYWWIIPESLRWLMSKGMRGEADQIIQKMAKVNKVKLPTEPLDVQINSSGRGTVLDLFCSKVLLIRTLIIFINWLTVSMMYYGLSLNVGNLGGDIYVNFVYSVVMEFVAYTISIPSMAWLGRKKFHCLSMLVGGLALLATIFPNIYADKTTSLVITMLAMIGKFASAAAFGTIYLYSTELFPTVVRSSGMGASAFCAGVGGIIAPYIVELANLTEGSGREVLPLIVFGIPSLLAGGLSLLLPETSKGRLPDSIMDAKRLNMSELESLSKTTEMTVMESGQRNFPDIETVLTCQDEDGKVIHFPVKYTGEISLRAFNYMEDSNVSAEQQLHSQTQEPQGKDCGDGWFEAGAKCYIFVPMPKTWPEAKILCETTHFNASMVQLETMEEKRHVVNHLQATYEKIVPMSFFWVGAVGADSAWLWISGMPLTYVDFAEGIKTAPGCLAFGVPSLQKYQGMACTQQNLVLCERGAPSGSISGTTGGVPIVG